MKLTWQYRRIVGYVIIRSYTNHEYNGTLSFKEDVWDSIVASLADSIEFVNLDHKSCT